MTATEYYKEHGITKASLEKFGITNNKEKIIIPIRDDEGNVLFNKYRWLAFNPQVEGGQKFSYDQGSSATLFNTAVLKDNAYAFLCEGEMDAIRLDQEGVSAISNTSGAATFKEEWVKTLEGKKIFILYDNDAAGIEGANKILEVLPSAMIINLPAGFKDVCEYFQKHNLDEFREMVDKQVKENTITYEQLCEVFDKWLLLPDKNVIRIYLATLISHFFSTDPLWMFFVAPPSGSKTEIISTGTLLPFVRMLSDLTANTLASGMTAKKDPSLLLQLKNNVLIMKDFTTVLSMRQEDKQIILGQLREVYDGKYNKAFGTGKVVDWEGRLTLIAGVTPAIDLHHSVFQIMGERFIMYRVAQADPVAVAHKALTVYGKEKEMREELKNAMKKYFMSLYIPHVKDIELPEDILIALSNLAAFIVKGRTAMVRDFKKELIYIPLPEAPSRLAKQLGTLLKALAVEQGRTKVTWNDYYMTLRTALDIIPANRMKHLISLCNKSISSTTANIAMETGYSTTGSNTILEDLSALGIASVVRGGKLNEWYLSSKTKEEFKKILPFDSEELYTIFPKDGPYAPLIEQMVKSSVTLSDEEVEKDAWETIQEVKTLF